jgi:hypothetical protein
MQRWGIGTTAVGIREAIRSNCSVSFTVVLTTLLSFRGFRLLTDLVILELSAVACLQCWGDDLPCWKTLVLKPLLGFISCLGFNSMQTSDKLVSVQLLR